MKPRKDKFDPEWNECSTMEEWAEKMIREGYIEIVKHMMKALPESSKEKYREIFKRIKEEKRNA